MIKASASTIVLVLLLTICATQLTVKDYQTCINHNMPKACPQQVEPEYSRCKQSLTDFLICTNQTYKAGVSATKECIQFVKDNGDQASQFNIIESQQCINSCKQLNQSSQSVYFRGIIWAAYVSCGQIGKAPQDVPNVQGVGTYKQQQDCSKLFCNCPQGDQTCSGQQENAKVCSYNTPQAQICSFAREDLQNTKDSDLMPFNAIACADLCIPPSYQEYAYVWNCSWEYCLSKYASIQYTFTKRQYQDCIATNVPAGCPTASSYESQACKSSNYALSSCMLKSPACQFFFQKHLPKLKDSDIVSTPFSHSCLAECTNTANSTLSNFFRDLIWNTWVYCGTSGYPPTQNPNFKKAATKQQFKNCIKNCPTCAIDDIECKQGEIDFGNCVYNGAAEQCTQAWLQYTGLSDSANVPFSVIACADTCQPPSNSAYFKVWNCIFVKCAGQQ